MTDALTGYDYFLRSHLLIDHDPLVLAIRALHVATHDGDEASDATVRHIVWRLWFERDRYPDLDAATADWGVVPGTGNGLRHDPRRMTAALLYPASPDWLFSERALSLTDDALDAYLRTPTVQQLDAVPVTLHVGSKASTRTLPCDARQTPDRAHQVLQRILDADKGVIAFVHNPEFFQQTLQAQLTPYYALCETTGREFAAQVNCFVLCWEIGKIFSGQHLEERTTAIQRLRLGTAGAGRGDVRIFQHERALEGIPRSDFARVDAAFTGSALQTGFDTTLPDAVAFVRDNVRRWRGYAPDHTVVVAEASIPFIYAGQPWSPTRTLDEARAWSATLVRDSGCATDWSGGARPITT